MINPKELRIGNLLNSAYSQKQCEVTGVFHNTPSIVSSVTIGTTCGLKTIDDLDPIKLTEEWLLRMGFEYKWTEKDDTADMKMGSKEYFMHPMLPKEISLYLPYFNFDYYIGNVEIKYVHQLQNLYFALTNKDLTECTPAKKY